MHAAAHGDGFRDALIAREKQAIWESVRKKDLKAVGGYLADEFVAVDPTGVYGKAETLRAIAVFDLTEYTLEDFKLSRPNRETAILTYRSNTKGTFQGQEWPPHVYETSVWVKRGARWLIVYHSDVPISAQ